MMKSSKRLNILLTPRFETSRTRGKISYSIFVVVCRIDVRKRSLHERFDSFHAEVDLSNNSRSSKNEPRSNMNIQNTILSK